eukprot:3515581-Pleurochrysis_carterae.AAC.1
MQVPISGSSKGRRGAVARDLLPQQVTKKREEAKCAAAAPAAVPGVRKTRSSKSAQQPPLRLIQMKSVSLRRPLKQRRGRCPMRSETSENRRQ